jgi:glutamate-ammonia-ligase adenylyltransferase
MQQNSIDYFHEHLHLLPEQLQQDVVLVFEQIAAQLPDPLPDSLPDQAHQPDWLAALPAVLGYSRFISGLLRKDSEYLTGLIDTGALFSPLDSGEMAAALETALAATKDEQEMMRILRRTRNRAMLQIAYRDLAGWAELEEVMTSLTRSAEVLLSATLTRTYELLTAKNGVPLGASGQAQQLMALGMGKLGGGELNFSSDVDLIFSFPENGQTDGNRPLSNSEFFTRHARLFIKLLTTQTADGFVYRVDTRLRPNGDSGPLCLSYSAMDNYYQLHGRDWERYAFIKANVVAGDLQYGKFVLENLRPFVYRKYLDFAAVESIREMKEMIERELARKKEMQRNIKLGPGGIREVEFIAQAYQLIRGGRDKNLQQRSLLLVLDQLRSMDLLSVGEFNCLRQGYDFLRRCENRLQMYADQQTHNLPESLSQQLILAHSMGYADWQSFAADLQHHMQGIHQIFHHLFMSTAKPEQNSRTLDLSHLWKNELDEQAACQLLEENNYAQPAELYTRLQALHGGSLYRSLSTTAANRLDRLLPVLLHEVGSTEQLENKDETILRCLDLLSSIARRPVYLSLLLDNGLVRMSLIQLTSASPYVSILLNRYPILLDDLLIGFSLADFDKSTLVSNLEKHVSAAEHGDLEQQMNLLREFQHSMFLGVAALDISTHLSAKETGRALSAIADACISESLKLSIDGIISSHGTPADCEQENLPFCVIGYGKLGSRELGFGSDLDLVFLSAGLPDSVKTSGPRKIYAAQFFARIGQRLVHIISTRTPAGRLYEIDMRLRPSGNSGPLVTTLASMQRYQREKAWTWEHQALIRARVIAGNQQLAEDFNALRAEILTRPRDDEKLKKDIVKMREKMRTAKISCQGDEFDLKQGYGGIVDIEFMVQYMVLRSAHEYPQLIRHTETQDLLDALMELQLLETDHHRLLTAAFSNWLDKSYQLKLNDRDAVIHESVDKVLRQQVKDIWDTIFLPAAAAGK